MANGKPKDHPLTDILVYGLDVFSPEADALVRELADLVTRERLYDALDWLSPPPLTELTAQLRERVREARVAARKRGWDV